MTRFSGITLPLALDFTRDIPQSAIVYDCMDELSAFRGAPVGLKGGRKQNCFLGPTWYSPGEEPIRE